MTRIETFLDAAIWHGSLDRATALLAEDPALATANIFIAGVLGDEAAVRRFLAEDPAHATARYGPFGGDALTYLCLSKYLRLEPARTPALLRTATALLDGGADAKSGFWTTGEHPEFETALYGAAGVAHHPEMTALLLARGADPNDDDSVYHSPETYDNRAMMLLVKTGRLTRDNLAMMLIRKHDWHDYEGVKYLLEHGTDPTLVRQGHSGVALAAREGRSDVLELFEQRGIPIALEGVDRLIAACAMGDAANVRALADAEPALVAELRTIGGTLLAKFCGTGNPPGVRQLLDLGIDVRAPFVEGDGYWGIPKGTLPIHIAAHRLQTDVVRLLIERGSPVDIAGENGATPLKLALRASVSSYWKEMRSTTLIKALLDAGASIEGLALPTGYAEADDLLR